MAHSKHSQLVHITNVLIVHCRYAILTGDKVTRKKLVEAEGILRRYKKFYYTLERF